jgi:hypothetical protein
MTLNITKKKIEKVLELFNHPQTRKIRKNRGKKRRRNNKSFNRKNGRKNLATSTLKKRGGHGHGHPPSVGGTVGVVLGGQVGGDDEKIKKIQNFITKLFSSKNKKKTERLKNYIRVKEDEDKKKQVIVNLLNKLSNKEKEFNGINEVKSIEGSDFSFNIDDVNFDVISVSENGVTVNNDPVDDHDGNQNNASEVSQEKNNKNYITLKELKGIDIDKFLKGERDEDGREGTDDDSTKTEIIDGGLEGKGTEDQQDQQDQQGDSKTIEPTPEETKTVETKSESKEIDTSEMLKVALASNYFTQYGILSGMLKMNDDKNNKTFDVMKFVQDPKLYAEFCNKMGFQFAEMKEEPVIKNENANTKPQDNNKEQK